MRIRIGDEIYPGKTTFRAAAELELQTGKSVASILKDSPSLTSAFRVFCALHAAGKEPRWEDILDMDGAEFAILPDLGDPKPDEDPAEDAPDPQ